MYYRFRYYRQAQEFIACNPGAKLVAWHPVFIVFIPRKQNEIT